MRLKGYLPDFVSEIREFKEIDKVCSDELDVVDQRLYQLQQDQFIESASSAGLARYEQMLKVQRDSDVDMRRFNLLTKFNSTIPFTMRWLQNMLNTTLGKDQYLIDLEPHKYQLTISVVKAKEGLIENLRKELYTKVPANLILHINVLNSIEHTVHTHTLIRTADKYDI